MKKRIFVMASAALLSGCNSTSQVDKAAAKQAMDQQVQAMDQQVAALDQITVAGDTVTAMNGVVFGKYRSYDPMGVPLDNFKLCKNFLAKREGGTCVRKRDGAELVILRP